MFLILVVVQYVVVTNGAQRVAEVAARFTLDSMPGKQMSIDADLNMGIIDEHEAKRRRGDIEREASFYGAMDGATKFVKGDAIAGIIIILIDIIGGLTIGLAQRGMSWSEALETYTLLTVGDGIVTQIPSLVIAVATGILITRAATDARLGDEVIRQVIANPRTLSLVAVVLGILLFMPGLPIAPVLLLACVFLLGTFYAIRKAPATTPEEPDDVEQAGTADGADFKTLLELQPVELLLGREAGALVEKEKFVFLEQFRDLRRRTVETMGMICPDIKVSDSALLAPNEYAIRFAGVTVGSGTLFEGRTLAINPGGERAALDGEATREPAYNLPATWIEKRDEDKAKSLGYTLVTPQTLLLTHFQELLSRRGYELLTRTATEELVENARPTTGGLVDELVPAIVTYADIQAILQALLRERVSIRNMTAILECLSDVARNSKDRHDITERVRERLGSQIVETLRGKKAELTVVTLDANLESRLLRAIKPSDAGPVLVPEPAMLDQLITGVTRACEGVMSKGIAPVIVCSARLRAPFKQFCERFVPNLMVLSASELAPGTPLSTVDVIRP